MEPTPFGEGFSLQVSPFSNNRFVLQKNKAVANEELRISSVNDFSKERELCLFDNSQTAKRQAVETIPSPQSKRAKHTESKNKLKPLQKRKWEEFFLSLLNFKKRHGHCRVPHIFPQDQALARWAKRQRYQYELKLEGKPNTLTTDRLDKMEQIGFVWDPQTSVWETRRKELASYLLEHGDCNVPCRYAKNPQLGMWVKRQRLRYKICQNGGSLSELAAERFGILNEMGFIWDARSEGRLPNESNLRWWQVPLWLLIASFLVVN